MTKKNDDILVTEKAQFRQFVNFKLANEEYALPIGIIKEVINLPKIISIPQMPDLCLGVIYNRGAILPIFDLRKMFRLEEKPFDQMTHLIIADIDHCSISIVVDEILDNVKIESSKIDPPPEVKLQIDKECIEGLGHLDDRIIIILDLFKMHKFIQKKIADFAENLHLAA